MPSESKEDLEIADHVNYTYLDSPSDYTTIFILHEIINIHETCLVTLSIGGGPIGELYSILRSSVFMSHGLILTTVKVTLNLVMTFKQQEFLENHDF